MSAELTKARQQLSQIKIQVKQNKLIPAVQGLQSALGTILRASLLSSERTEFEDMLRDAAGALANAEAIRKVFPLSLSYTPGQERDFLDTIQQLGEILQGMAVENAEEQLQLLEARKKIALIRAQEHMDKGEYAEADAIYKDLAKQMPGDVDLFREIGEIYLKAERYEDAFIYFSRAIEIDPSLVSLYNRIGIALRKLNKYETAEMYYRKALEYSGRDPNLFFNIGRLYIEWGKWTKAEQVANVILKLDPNFVEAGKLRSFAQRKKAEEEAARVAEDAEAEVEKKPEA